MNVHKHIVAVNSLVSEASFWTPDLLVESAWHEHAPFAFWLMDVLRPRKFVELGCYQGFSYLAFCQAADRLELEARGFAVDTWQGDAHTGRYGEDVYAHFVELHDRRYPHFSELVRASFDEALERFADRSIDLLHIDGQHFYEDVEHDFSSWKPKLSDRAVVLFHDTNVKDRGFGVHKLWEELRQHYPAFEFHHGHGLGVLGIGSQLPVQLTTLFAAASDDVQAEQIQAIYARLGGAVTDRYRLDQKNQEVADLKHELTCALQDGELTKQKLVAQEMTLEEQTRRGENDARRISALQQQVTETDFQLRAAKDRLDELQRAADERLERIGRLDAALEYAECQRSATEAQLADQAERIGQLETERDAHAAQAAASEAKLTASLEKAERAERRVQEIRNRLGDLQKKTASSRWLVKTIGGKLIHAPRDISRRARASLRKYSTPRIGVSAFANSVNRTLDFIEGSAGRPHSASLKTPDIKTVLQFEYDQSDADTVLALLKKFGMHDVDVSLPASTIPEPSSRKQKTWLKELHTLASTRSINKTPDVSIILPVHNQKLFTLACLTSLFSFPSKFYFDIIVGDDASTDATHRLFTENLPQVKYIRHDENQGFLQNCNRTAAYATGHYLVFLNNDTVVLPNWLDKLVATLEEDENVGLVSSRLIYPDGRLQEAGGLIFEDGTGWNFGRGGNPIEPHYNYLRDIDYGSGASIAIRRDLWDRLDGFDQRYSPAYYEDTDLAFRVREDAGQRVVYQPKSALIHFEGVSNGRDIEVGQKRFQEVNRQTFIKRWSHVLANYGPLDRHNLPVNRPSRGRILVIDAETPFTDRDSGSIDTFNYLKIFKSLGYHVSFTSEHQSWDGQYSQKLQEIGVEVLFRPFWTQIHDVLCALGSSFDYIFLYRAPVAEKIFHLARQYAPQAKIIFDTVDLHFLRLEREAELKNCERLSEKAARMRRVELDLIRSSDASIVLSKYEEDLVKTLCPEAVVHQIPVVREIPPLKDISFHDRRDIAFIGGFRHPPNVDAVRWFIKEVWPLVRANGVDARFLVVGSDLPDELRDLADYDIEMRGFVEDLSEVLDRCRLTVAPLRYGAGLKGKVITSLSHGVPVVGTTIAAEGSGLEHGKHILIADKAENMAVQIRALFSSPQDWASLATTGYTYCSEVYSLSYVKTKISELLDTSGHSL